MGPKPAIFELRAELLDVQPAVRRRLRIPRDATLGDLHRALQALFSWQNLHLHQFTSFDGVPYCDLEHDPEAAPEAREERGTRLDEVLLEPGTRLGYEYDFGDEWEVAVVLERVVEPAQGETYPRLVAGERAAPPEDCGGPSEYEEILAILADAAHPEHDEIAQWLPAGFDPGRCDGELIRRRLHALRIWTPPVK